MKADLYFFTFSNADKLFCSLCYLVIFAIEISNTFPSHDKDFFGSKSFRKFWEKFGNLQKIEKSHFVQLP